MRLSITRQWLGAVALFGALAFVAACSGSTASGSMSPTAPSSFSAFADGGSLLAPNCFDGSCDVPDPCLSTSAVGLHSDPPPAPCVGRFTGGGFQFDESGVKVTRGFTIHCDNVLANNLEINWDGGQNFHMDKNSLTNITCDLIGAPKPPVAPVNRIIATATGKYNGVAGAVVTFTLIDNGEPGKDNDQAALHVVAGGDTVLEVVLGPIDGGNIQAHYDQPHGNKPNK